MTRPIDIYFMIGIPVALAVVLVMVLFSGRLKPGTRTGAERIMVAIFYPAATIFWLWRAYEFVGEGRGINAALMVVVAVAFGWLSVRAIRTGRLAVQDREPT